MTGKSFRPLMVAVIGTGYMGLPPVRRWPVWDTG